jgi:hypothetical protein
VDPKLDDSNEDFDFALDSSDILEYLPGSDSFPFLLAQPTTLHQDPIPDNSDPRTDSEDVLADLDVNLVGFGSTLSHKPSDNILSSNSEVIAYQQVLATEDHRLECIRTFLTVSNSPDIQTVVKPHLSPRLRYQLPSNLLSRAEDPENRSRGVCEPLGPKGDDGQHIPSVQQKKERRKQSYSIR